MAQAYYRKWRPLDWDGVIGQDHVVQTLRNALMKNRVAHAYLFSGPRGTGKTSTARIIAKAVNCLADDINVRPCNKCEHCEAINSGRFLDLIEIDAASNTSVDDVRSLREKINFSPTQGKYKVYIIDEVHMLSNAAFNALLKTLEEPPAHAIFILATTEVHKIPPTVLSRCQRHEFRRIPINFIQASLKEIVEKEKIEVDTAALTEIARQATGSMRDAVSLLDQLASTGIAVTLAITKSVLGTAGNENVKLLAEALLENDAGKGLTIIGQALDSGSDPRQFGRQIVDYLRAILMAKIGNIKELEVTVEERECVESLSKRFEMSKLLNTLQVFDRAAQATSVGWQPGLQLELAVTRLTQPDGTQSRSERKQNVRISKGSNQAKKAVPNRAAISDHNPTQTEKSQSKEKKSPLERQESPATNVDEPIKRTGENSIQSQLKEIRIAAKSISPETGALLNSCKTFTMRRGRLVLGFSSPILKSKMENGQNKIFAQNAIKQVTSQDLEIDCEVVGKESTSVPDDVDVEKDGMLGTALSLGGKMAKKE